VVIKSFKIRRTLSWAEISVLIPLCCFLDVVIDDNLSLASQEMDSNWVSITSSHIAIMVNPDYLYYKITMKQNGEQMSFFIILLFFFLFYKQKNLSLFSNVKSKK
jgi:hypothetical protein